MTIMHKPQNVTFKKAVYLPIVIKIAQKFKTLLQFTDKFNKKLEKLKKKFR